MIITKNAETDYLLKLLRCAIKGGDAPDGDGVNFNKLLKLADSQQVYTTVLPVLEKSGALTEEQEREWNNLRLSELKKTITVDSERAIICENLDREKIKYIFLKGLNIRGYYPKSSMRQMSDNDILYDETRRDDLCRIMKKQGYYIGASGGISDDFYKKPYATFEFHRTLFNPEEEFCPEFNPWLNAKPYGKGSSRYVMSKEDNYIYAVGHMYKHYYCIDGCGVRFICDLYLLSHSDDELDWDYINKTLGDFGILEFNETALELADSVFEDRELTERAKELLDFLFNGGVFGKSSYDINDEVEKYGSKSGFILHRIFPSYEDMKREYRTLEKKPFLLPAYYVYRLFDKYRHNRKYMKRDIDALKNRK